LKLIPITVMVHKWHMSEMIEKMRDREINGVAVLHTHTPEC